MSHFLVAGGRIVVHLLSLWDLFSIRPNCTFCFSLVGFTDCFSIRANLLCITVLHDLELTLSTFTATHLHHSVHIHHHITLFHNLINSSEAAFSVEKRIIFEWIIKSHAETSKHAVCHVIERIPLHHREHVTSERHHHTLIFLWFVFVVGLNGLISICHLKIITSLVKLS